MQDTGTDVPSGCVLWSCKAFRNGLFLSRHVSKRSCPSSKLPPFSCHFKSFFDVPELGGGIPTQ